MEVYTVSCDCFCFLKVLYQVYAIIEIYYDGYIYYS